jgi:hypothetical protein
MHVVSHAPAAVRFQDTSLGIFHTRYPFIHVVINIRGDSGGEIKGLYEINGRQHSDTFLFLF